MDQPAAARSLRRASAAPKSLAFLASHRRAARADTASGTGAEAPRPGSRPRANRAASKPERSAADAVGGLIEFTAKKRAPRAAGVLRSSESASRTGPKAPSGPPGDTAARAPRPS